MNTFFAYLRITERFYFVYSLAWRLGGGNVTYEFILLPYRGTAAAERVLLSAFEKQGTIATAITTQHYVFLVPF